MTTPAVTKAATLARSPLAAALARLRGEPPGVTNTGASGAICPPEQLAPATEAAK